LRTDPRFYPTDEESFLRYVREICKIADGKITQFFSFFPRCPYSVRPMDLSQARTAPAAYYFRPNNDCSRPGYYMLNTYDLKSRPLYSQEALALHEAVPGTLLVNNKDIIYKLESHWS
jgi:uncharacterized protein (DUF885 family)